MPNDNTDISDTLCSLRNSERLCLPTAKLWMLFSLHLVYNFQVLPWMSELCCDVRYHPGWYLKKQSMEVYVTMRRVCVTIVAVENTKCYILWGCTCSLMYPACNARAPYFYLCPVRSKIFSTLSHKRYDFWKNVNEHKMCVLIFSEAYFSGTFLVLRRIQWDMIKDVNRSACKTFIIFVGI